MLFLELWSELWLDFCSFAKRRGLSGIAKYCYKKMQFRKFCFGKKHEVMINSRDALFKNIDLSETRNLELFTDASCICYGGYIKPTAQRSGNFFLSRVGIESYRWTVSCVCLGVRRDELRVLIWQEFEWIHRIFNTHSDDWKGSSLVVYSDRTNASNIVEVGSMKTNLQPIAFGFFSVL